MQRDDTALSAFARAGFHDLSESRERLAELRDALGTDLAPDDLRVAADPDAALRALLDLQRTDGVDLAGLWADGRRRADLVRVLGASEGLAGFLLRHPEQLSVFDAPPTALPDAAAMREDVEDALGVVDGFASSGDEDAWTVLRVRYRRWLTRIAAFDLAHDDPTAVLQEVSACLADAAAVAIDAALAVARARLVDGTGPGTFPREDVERTRLAVIGMGKTGARELNYVSDVDVIYVAEGVDELSSGRAIDVATRLAVILQRAVGETSFEPALWEVDPNLRPEGKSGALVRTLDSHLRYYERWAKNWEFQALLKARPLAGDLELGRRYVDALTPQIWGSSERDGFVESVQKMRQRVTDNIAPEDVHYQIKLGPGGLRDVEFTVQLLQLVHGQADESLRVRGTLDALEALASGGYIGRQEGAEFAQDYRYLRVLEHRLQLTRLRRTHLMPRDEDELRVLARAARAAGDARSLVTGWERTKHSVRQLHERLFYRPLLAAVAALPEEELSLTTEQAAARLFAIGFTDPKGALGHIGALTAGVSRRAAIQRHLLPVMLRWFADGADPDYGLLAFRRLSDALGSTHWFLRMLRDSSAVAERLTKVLSGSRYIGELLEAFPEASAWLEDDEELRPRDADVIADEMAAIFSRHDSVDTAAKAVLRVRRREILRLALAAVLEVATVTELGAALTAITEATISGVLRAVRRTSEDDGSLEFAVIGMGRFGGAELGFGSDADVLYVYRPTGEDAETAQRVAQRYAKDLARLTDDARLPLDLDLDLRPEGKNGPVVRSLSSYRAYYERWSLTWEAQALLRARGVAGDDALIADFTALADEVRYPAGISEHDVREVKRIKARVENERLPRGADPLRHVKLGRGSLSDVEWFVQLIQLQHGARIPELRTTSTLRALEVATENGLVEEDDARHLSEAWILASRVRSAMTLWLNRTTDVLPDDRAQLEGIARVLEYPQGCAAVLEEDYLSVTRKARRVFERAFYGEPEKRMETRAF